MKTIQTCPGRLVDDTKHLTNEQKQRAGVKATGLFGELVTVKLWPARAALQKTIEMQRRREHRNGDWTFLVRVTP